jgi:hypothetical protein
LMLFDNLKQQSACDAPRERQCFQWLASKDEPSRYRFFKFSPTVESVALRRQRSHVRIVSGAPLYDFVRFPAEACRRRSNAALRRLSYAADLLLRDCGGAGSSVDVKMREPQPPRLATSAP